MSTEITRKLNMVVSYRKLYTLKHFKNQTEFDSEGKPAVHPDHGHVLIELLQHFTTNASSILSETPSDCPKPDSESIKTAVSLIITLTSTGYQ